MRVGNAGSECLGAAAGRHGEVEDLELERDGMSMKGAEG